MKIEIKSSKGLKSSDYAVFIIKKGDKIPPEGFTAEELNYLNKKADGEELLSINKYSAFRYIFQTKQEDGGKVLDPNKILEQARKAGAKIYNALNTQKAEKVYVLNNTDDDSLALAMAEGITLASYKFNKYLKDKSKKSNSLEKIVIYSNALNQDKADYIRTVSEAVFKARDLVNEPVNYLTAVKLGEEFREMSSEAGFKADIFEKGKIESLKMGGLLAVNKGSIDPPTFSVLEWKPENAVNKKPIILVGKGVVYDTGGLSLKPTPDSMDYMKCDMAGAAAVACAIYAAAKAKLPLHIIVLVPATDNRPDGNAYVPGDIIYMHNGMSVEVLNTDAEGRLILADALSYAKQFDPELVIDAATLTGAAHVAIGPYGLVGMCTENARDEMEKLKVCGNRVYERVAEFPFWDEYYELMKSDIADMKNIGGKYAGAITAGKFLEKFTDYPYIHLDIAGPAFSTAENGYIPKGGTGYAVRLLFEYLKEKAGVLNNS